MWKTVDVHVCGDCPGSSQSCCPKPLSQLPVVRLAPSRRRHPRRRKTHVARLKQANNERQISCRHDVQEHTHCYTPRPVGRRPSATQRAAIHRTVAAPTTVDCLRLDLGYCRLGFCVQLGQHCVHDGLDVYCPALLRHRPPRAGRLASAWPAAATGCRRCSDAGLVLAAAEHPRQGLRKGCSAPPAGRQEVYLHELLLSTVSGEQTADEMEHVALDGKVGFHLG